MNKEIEDSIKILENTDLDINTIDSVDLHTYNFAVKSVLNYLSELQEENKAITKASIEAAFDDMNQDTELLMRCLLKYNKIKLENGVYTRDTMEWEEHMTLLGFDISKEKLYFIGEDSVDEYIKTLEDRVSNSISFAEIGQILKNNKSIKAEDKASACWVDLIEKIDKRKVRNVK